MSVIEVSVAAGDILSTLEQRGGTVRLEQVTSSRRCSRDLAIMAVGWLFKEGLVTVQQDSIIMQPGDFILAATREAVSLPKDIVGQLTGKSSLARLGIMVHVTAGFIDAGFSDPPAQITLEIVNLGNRPVKLYAGMPIGQIVFTATQECQVSYSQKPGAKYNGQPAAAHSRYYLNKV